MAMVTQVVGFAAIVIGGHEVTGRKACRLEVNERADVRMIQSLIFQDVQGEGKGKVRVYKNLSSPDWFLEFAVDDVSFGENVVITKLPEGTR